MKCITDKCKIAPEGFPLIRGFACAAISLILISLIVKKRLFQVLSGIFSIIWLGILYFFRDPPRTCPATSDGKILSPADGHVISVESIHPVYGRDIIQKKVSIFLSLFDVHVIRSPVKGTIRKIEYRRGKFLPAFVEKSTSSNEQTRVYLDTKYGECSFALVAGLIARRIVFHPAAGENLDCGQRTGIIKFGSRVDLFLPDTVTLNVEVAQKVKAGKTILGFFNEK